MGGVAMSDIPGTGGSSDKPQKVRLAKGQEVSLGCGTLVLIALIVMFFSGRSGGHRDELRGLEREIDALKKAVDAQTAEIRLLRERLTAPPKMGEVKEKEERKGKE
jgi:hypothetical protein